MSAPCPTYGFRVSLALAAPTGADALRDAWIDFLAGRGLYCVGGGVPDALEYVVASEAAQAVEADRAATRAWLAARRDLRAWAVGGLEDLDDDA